MKALLFLLLSAASLPATLPEAHPLRHPKASVISQPLGILPKGGIHLNELIGYVLGSEDEATAARTLLQSSGYGPTGTHYLWANNAKNRFIVDGHVFHTIRDAKEHLRENNIRVALYIEESQAFPSAIPAAFTSSAIALWTLDSHK